jgi:putative addiction module component (TIGR02574 family)
MTVAAKKTFIEALALSENERITLAHILLKSIHSEDDLLSRKDWDKSWKHELEKRIAKIDSGKVKCIPYDIVKKEMDALLSQS